MIILANSTFGNYNLTSYDLIINPILFIIYFNISFIICFWTRNKIKYKKIYFLFLIPIIFVCLSSLYGKNIHKNITFIGEIDNYPSTYIKLYDNQTFEITIQYPHVTEIKKGRFETNVNELHLLEPELEKLTDSLYTDKYLIVNDSILEPLSNKFKKITVPNN